MIKSLLLICGRLPVGSTLALQLKLKDIFALRLGRARYLSETETIVDSLSAEFSAHWLAEVDPSEMRVLEFTKILDVAIPDWRSYRNVIVWPAWYRFSNTTEFIHLLEKLAVSDVPAALSEPVRLSMAPVAAFLKAENRDCLLGALHRRVELSSRGEVFDLSQVEGLFRYSRTATSARAFNQIQADGPYLLKRSRQTDKLRGEYGFLRDLPAPLRPYFPTIGDFNDGKESCEYQVEFVPAFDLSRLLLHGVLEPAAFAMVLQKLDLYFARCPKAKVSREQYASAMKNLFIVKLEERTAALRNHAEGLSLLKYLEPLFPAGFETFLNDLKSALEEAVRAVANDELCLSHGDLCLSNILFDTHTGLLKLIDPRGYSALTENSSYLPILYDLAKLSHSVLGGYDLICNGVAEIKVHENLSMTLDFASGGPHLDALREPFESWLKRRAVDLKLLRLCEASLFMSMLPLHLDRPSHVIMQAIAGRGAFQAALGLAGATESGNLDAKSA